MTILFKEGDSLYKIFSTLKKLPPYRKASIIFPARHEIFNHPRWWKQLQELVTEYHLDVNFVVSSRKHSLYFESVGLQVLYEPPHSPIWRLRRQFNKIIRWDTPWTHKKVVSRLIILAELAIFILLWSFFWWVISPKATIQIESNAQIRPLTYRYLLYPSWSWLANDSLYTTPLTLPYEQVTLEYTTSLWLDIADITYTTSPAQWSIRIINTLPSSYSLVQWTQFVTDQWNVYRSDTSIEIPAWTSQDPVIVSARLTSTEVNDLWVRQWEDANILEWTRLRIKNLSESMVMQWIRAESIDRFEGWRVKANWVVSENDIATLRRQLEDTMDENKRNYLNQATQWDSDYFNLPFDRFISFTPTRFETDAEQWDDLIQIQWTITGELTYHRIARSDLINAMKNHLLERPLVWYRLMDTDQWSLRMYDLIETPTTGQYYMPTRLNTIRGYDFENDQNGIESEIIQRIAWRSRDEAQSIILWYEQVQQATISMSPPWYDTLPESTERITIEGTESS